MSGSDVIGGSRRSWRSRQRCTSTKNTVNSIARKSSTVVSIAALCAACSARGARTRVAPPPRGLPAIDARVEDSGYVDAGCRAGAVRVAGGEVFVTRHPPRLLPADGGPYFAGATVRVSSFCLDAFEVSAAKLQACVRSGRCRRERRWDLLGDPQFCALDDPSVGVGEHDNGSLCTDRRPAYAELPANCVRFDSAREYCQSVGGDLPTEEQFQLAAKASVRVTLPSQSSSFNLLDPVALRRFRVLFPSDVRPASQDAEPFLWPAERASPDVVDSIFNLRGNVSEWVRTSDVMQRVVQSDAPENSRRAGSSSSRGGSFLTSDTELEEASGAVGSAPTGHCYASSAIGFRCAFALSTERQLPHE
jgi:formylglycine-generating enzyme required for sulfatase activity